MTKSHNPLGIERTSTPVTQTLPCVRNHYTQYLSWLVLLGSLVSSRLYHCHKNYAKPRNAFFELITLRTTKANAKVKFQMIYLSHMDLGATGSHVSMNVKNHMSQAIRKQKRQDICGEFISHSSARPRYLMLRPRTLSRVQSFFASCPPHCPQSCTSLVWCHRNAHSCVWVVSEVSGGSAAVGD